MRLDKYLSMIRVFKSRTLAGEAASSNMVFCDGLPAKPSREIKPGYIIEINTPLFYKKLEILKVPSGNVSKRDVPTLFNLLEDRRKD